jgi:alkanesulfonate monooxygenase SsuD/methylene tetrahydromethanopterin reductase-like flavin-dependent oxidoreductase (luciferase family)
MRYGVYVPTFGEYDVATLVALAREAEDAGWDGFFIWDHLIWTPQPEAPVADTTVALTAIALATERVRFGALVTPLARRRPWKVAKEAATLDRLSRGRLVLGVGLGGHGDLEPVAEPVDERERAALLDEGLEVMTALWSGDPVSHAGRAFRLAEARMLPTPLQQPRIPIWVGGFWPNKPPFRRAARWDGAIPLRRGSLLEGLSPAELHDCIEYVRAHRAGHAPLDVLAFGTSREWSRELVEEYGAAGATWWIDAVNPLEESLADFRARMIRGPLASTAGSHDQRGDAGRR